MVKLAIGRWRALWHGGLPPRSAVAVLFALVCVAIATIVRIGLGAISPASAVFAPYYSATLVAALVGGAGAGGVAAVSGALAAFWLFVPPDWTSDAYIEEQVVSFFLFAASSLVIIWAAKSYRDLLARLRAEQQTRLLLNHELSHRIKNTLAIVQALIGQTLRDQPALAAKLYDRIAALAATNDLLVKADGRGAFLKNILAGEFAPYEASRFHLDGEDFECPSEIAIMLALIFHELTTNAVKYGALSTTKGRIELSWRKSRDRVDFDWIEHDGPQPSAAPRPGFGTTLLRKGPQQFDGAVQMQFAPSGLHCRLSLRVPSASQQAALAISDSEEFRAGAIASSSISTAAR